MDKNYGFYCIFSPLPNIKNTLWHFSVFLIADYEVVPDYFAQALMKLPMLYDEEYVKDGMKETACFDESQKDLPYAKYPELVMP